MSNFWSQVSKPIFALAPMEDVTDTVFREIIANLSDPEYLQVLFTEFTSIDGMNHPIGKISVGERLIVNKSEQKILKEKNIKLVAQIWGKDPKLFYKIAMEITQGYNFDGLDINMGCPVKNIVKNGGCSALINDPILAKEIILATKEGTHLPVSVKTRTGIKSHHTEEWISDLMETKPAAVILHGRTQKQQSEGLADWDEIAKGAIVRNQISPDTVFLGNGDIASLSQGIEYAEKYKLDGIMVGRGIFHNPWFFNSNVHSPEKSEKLSQMLLHTQLFEKTWGGKKNINILKRFYKIYTHNFQGASNLRSILMETKTYEEVYKILHNEIGNI